MPGLNTEYKQLLDYEVATPFKLDEDKRSDLQRLIRSSSVKDWSKASARFCQKKLA
jgi:hypothetical protein